MIAASTIEARCAAHGITITIPLHDGWAGVSSLSAASERVAKVDQALAHDLEMQAEAMRKRLTKGAGR